MDKMYVLVEVIFGDWDASDVVNLLAVYENSADANAEADRLNSKEVEEAKAYAKHYHQDSITIDASYYVQECNFIKKDDSKKE